MARKGTTTRSEPRRPPNGGALRYDTWVILDGWEKRPARTHPFVGPAMLERWFPRPWQRGVPIAFFRSRAQARDVLRTIKRKCPKARIQRATVVVDWNQYA